MDDEREILHNSDETPSQNDPLTHEEESINPDGEPETIETFSPVPPTTTDEPTEINEYELLHEQFDNYLRIAKALMTTLKRPKDVEICSNLLRRTQKLNNSSHLEVKRNNNIFFRYCLRVIKWTSDNQPLAFYRKWFDRQGDEKGDANLTDAHTWLEEKKSYMALKTFKDGVAIIYAAVANDPEGGWLDGGLKILEKRGACGRF